MSEEMVYPGGDQSAGEVDGTPKPIAPERALEIAREFRAQAHAVVRHDGQTLTFTDRRWWLIAELAEMVAGLAQNASRKGTPE